MKPTQNLLSFEDGKKLLAQLPELYFAVLKSAQIEYLSMEQVRCSVELPVLGKRTKTAPTTRDAIRAVLFELSEVLTETPSSAWPKSWLFLSSPPPSEDKHSTQEQGEMSARFQSKVRQLTIGVTLPIKLQQQLQKFADQQDKTFADTARRCTSIGFEDFDERSFSEGSKKLLTVFTSEVENWLPSDTEQIMIRLEPNLTIRIRSTAKEYGKSASEFLSMCLAHGFLLQKRLPELERKIEETKGPPVRKLAPMVGLGDCAHLLSGILAGSIAAPRKVLKDLSKVLEAPQFALVEIFARSFEKSPSAAFKSEKGKPSVRLTPTSWENAVKSLDLPSTRTKELLQLNR